MYVWGRNHNGQLASKESQIYSPEKVKFGTGLVPIDVACGAGYTMVAMGTKVLYCLCVKINSGWVFIFFWVVDRP